MAKDPAVLFYTSDFLSGTFTMDYEQKGKYITLLCIQHQKGFLTEKDLKLVLEDTDVEIFNKFKLSDDGNYYNIKMKECADKRKSYSESRSNNRKGKTKDMNIISKSYVKHMNNTSSTYDNHMENGNENENRIINEDINDNVNVNTNTGVINKILNNLIQLDDSKKHFQAVEDLEEIGGIDYIADILRWDTSVKNNWTQKIYSSNQIHSGIFPD